MAASFTKASGEALWLLDPQPAACRVVFAPFEDATPPATLTLAESWSKYQGTYAFTPAAASLDAAFADRLATFVGLRPGTRLAWVANPNDDARAWDAATIALGPSGTTNGLAPVALNNISLWIGAGCAIAPDTSGDALVLTPPAGGAYLTTGSGAATLPVGAPLAVPFEADHAGCLTTALELDPASDLDRLDVGMRIFAADPGSALGDRLSSWRFPFLRSAGDPIPLALALDPLHPLDPSRTQLGLVPARHTSGPELASCYTTTNGATVMLTPLAEPPAKLVLAVRALSNPAAPLDPYYLVPSGAFAIRIVDRHGRELEGAQRLMCGVSGIEYVTLEQPGSEIWFAPRSDALAGAHGLGPGAQTAYASIFGPRRTALTYRAQPDDAAMFSPSSVTGVLAFHELDGVTLRAPPTDGSIPAGFPMLAFTGLGAADLTAHLELEQQKVAPRRRADIDAPGKTPLTFPRAGAPAAVTATKTTTRQGLLATLDGTSIDIQLAQSGHGADIVVLSPVSPALASALQTNQLFLVACDAAALGTVPSGTGAVTIGAGATDTWTLQLLSPKGWTTPPTLLVFKFANKALTDLVDDISTWSGAEVFNPQGTAGAVQQRLRGIIADAQTRARSDSDFAPFAAIAADPAWQGILALDCAVALDGLPEQLTGLAAGIDPSSFAAHHIGLTVTPVAAGASGLTTQDSSLFGLIDYVSPTTAAGAQPPYAFQVDTLKVRFANSAVVTFASRIQLLVDELFGEPASLQGSAANVLLLDGAYQLQGGVGAYSFHATQDNVFKIQSAVLDSVDVATAQFVTVKPPTKGDATKPAESRFTLSGSLRFKPPPQQQTFDLFSFGPASDGSPAGALSFSNLAINVVYYPDRSQPDAYTFDATALALDMAQSKSRPGGLFASFPLSPAGLIQVEKPPSGAQSQPATPASLGFLGVQADAAGGTISAPWFGIVADLGLGTVGALASGVGLKASLLAAWSPGKSDTPNVAIGLRLPGTGGGGGKLLSLENVIKLKIAELTLAQTGTTYVLQLDRIAIELLSLSFPPSGQTEVLLFADPAGSNHTTLGWFAGYAKE